MSDIAPCPKSANFGSGPFIRSPRRREREERGRHSEAERLGGPEIDGKLEMGRHLDRKIAGPRALEEAGEIASERTGEGRDGAIDRACNHVRCPGSPPPRQDWLG